MPSSLVSGRLKTLNAYACPMHMNPKRDRDHPPLILDLQP